MSSGSLPDPGSRPGVRTTNPDPFSHASKRREAPLEWVDKVRFDQHVGDEQAVVREFTRRIGREKTHLV
jgi:hypothetical protein